MPGGDGGDPAFERSERRLMQPAVPALLAALALALPAAAQDALPEGIGTDFLPPAEGPEAQVTASPLPSPPLPAEPEGDAPPPTQEVTDRAAEVPGPPEPPLPEEADEPPAGVTDGQPEPSPLPGPAVPHTPLSVLTELWRQAVADGRTRASFEDWTAAELGMEPGRSAAPAVPESQVGRTRQVASEWAVKAGPVTLGTAGRVVTTFGAAIPQALCSSLTVCYIELERGEALTDTPSWGDTARWQVVAKVQGRDPETVVLEIKPSADAGHTNLVIPTDRRLYTISLINDPDVHTPILSFRYPDSAAREAAAAVEARRKREAQDAAAAEIAAQVASAAARERLDREGVPVAGGSRLAEDLDFGFRIDGQAPFRPVRVFADGRRTYIDLHPRYKGALPAVIPAEGEDNRALNTRVTEGGLRLVADRVIADIWLQAGRKRVRIRREDAP